MIPGITPFIVLLAESTGSMLNDFVQTGSFVGVLGFFLWFFMKEWKELRKQMDDLRARHQEEMDELRQQHELKFDRLFERFAEMERKNSETNNKVAEALNKLITKMGI
jgi:predicted PurR-regulated permease PerM